MSYGELVFVFGVVLVDVLFIIFDDLWLWIEDLIMVVWLWWSVR